MPPITAIDKATAPATVEAALCFILPQAEKPLFHSAAYTGGDPKIFFKVEDRTVKITDIRKSQSSHPLNAKGSNSSSRRLRSPISTTTRRS